MTLLMWIRKPGTERWEVNQYLRVEGMNGQSLIMLPATETDTKLQPTEGQHGAKAWVVDDLLKSS